MIFQHKTALILFYFISIISMAFSENTVRGLLKSSNIAPSDIYTSQWALIVGIDNYHDFPQLNYAVEDAKSIKILLTTQFGFPEENIILLLDDDATKTGITDAFYILGEKTQSNDAVVVFFAGHGETYKISGSNEDLGYLIPIDGKMGSLPRSAFSMEAINIHANEIPAKSMLFLVDACYGGLAAAGQFRSGRKLDIIKGLTKDRCRQIITAGKKEELVVENEKWQHSAFTRVLLDGLQKLEADTDQDGIIMANQLYAFIQNNVLKLTEGGQTPQFNNLSTDEGEFVFIDQNLMLGDLDIDRSSFGFFTISTEPFGAFIKIDDILINKKTPAIDEKISSGYHTITVFKRGYKDFSKRVFFKPNETIVINPVMHLVEGILSFSSLPKNSKVLLDGTSVGTTPLENMSLEQGKHTFEISIPGYEDIPLFDVNIDSSIVYPLILPRLIPKTRMKAFMRSAIVPGWGQRYYEKPMKSTGIGTAALLSALFCLYNQLQYSQLSADYDKADADYQNSWIDIDVEMKAKQRQNVYEQLAVNENNTTTGVVIFGGIYTLNLIDILLEKSFTSSSSFSKKRSEPDVKVGITPNGPGLEIGIRY